MAKSIMLLRHAEAISNRNKTFAGWTDAPLTELGREQAKLLSKRLSKENFAHVFCSDLSRAKDTLTLSEISAPTTYSPQLREKNYGKIEGLDWGKDPSHHDEHTNPFSKPPEGESAQEVQMRVVNYFQNTILKSGADDVLIVSHHGPVVLLACHLLHISIEHWRSLRMGNAGLSRFDWEEGRFRLTLWNSLSHLGMKTNRALFAEKG